MTNMPKISPAVEGLIARAEADCAEAFRRIDQVEYANTRRVIEAFQRHRVSARHFAPTTGYCYDDVGRDTMEKIFADLFGTEAAIVRGGDAQVDRDHQ